MTDSDSKIALVTGAASGIGLATAYELATRGYDLLLVDRDAEGLAQAEAEVRGRGRRAESFVVDLADKAAIAQLADQAWERFGHVDLLFNNAGVLCFGTVARMSLEDWEWIVDVNLWAPIRLTRALLPRMQARGTGRIAVTGSAAGLFSMPGLAAYSVTKRAMVAFCEALRAEVSQHGISVTVACPTLIKTNLAQGGRYASEADQKTGSTTFSGDRGMPVDKAARLIVDGIERGQGHVVFGGGARPLWWIDRASPAAAHLVRRGMLHFFERQGRS
jgi:short-subunit dehydrogenase